MHRLLVNPGSQQAWEICLRPGTNKIGRGEENDFTIPHNSISTCHCEIEVGDGVVVKDLDSTNGTFVNDRPVREEQLRPGETLQLGSVKMLLETANEPGRETMTTRAPAETTSVARTQTAKLHLHEDHAPAHTASLTSPMIP